jgi:hypothetical protein
VSKNNVMIMRSHANNPAAHVRKSLPNDYLLIEFVPSGERGNASRARMKP